jgi:WD repeat-containing protein 35|tara:strand:- start:2001 stop:2546 length:546 start_codon:yes stop_codon:yes gene_type:complete
VNNEYLRSAELLVFSCCFDDAERIYKEAGYINLAIGLRIRLGDWLKAAELLTFDSSNAPSLSFAWNNIGEYYSERRKLTKAVEYYTQANNTSRLVDCIYALEDFRSFDQLVNAAPLGGDILREIGSKCVSVGLCEPATRAYLRAGDIHSAVDACIDLNNWNEAMQIASDYNFKHIEARILF